MLSPIVRWSRQPWFPAVFFLIVAFFLTVEYGVLGPFSYARVGDNMDTFVPRIATAWADEASYRSYWYPYLAGGADRLSNDISYTHISLLLSRVLPTWGVYYAVLFGSVFVGSFFMFRLCKEACSFSMGASLIAGVVFGFMLLYEDILPFLIGFGILPCILYGIETMRKKIGTFPYAYLVGYAVLFGCIHGMSSSFIFTFPFTCIAIVWWCLWRKEKRMSVWSLIAILLGVAMLFHVQEFFSLLLNAPLSQRSGGYYHGSIPEYITAVRHLLHFYGIPLILFIGGMLLFRIKDRFAVALFVCMLCLLFVFPAYQTVTAPFARSLGPLADFNANRLYLLLPFLFALASAHIIDHLSGYVVMPHGLRQVSLRKIVIVGIVVLLAASQVMVKADRTYQWLKYGGYKVHAYSGDLAWLSAFTAGQAPFRIATITSGNDHSVLLPTLPHFFGFETVDGHVNLANRRYIDFFGALSKNPRMQSSLYLFEQKDTKDIALFAKDAATFLNEALLSFANVRFIISTIPMNLPGFIRLDTPSTHAVQEKQGTEDSLGFFEKQRTRLRRNMAGRSVFIYENQMAMPRLFFAPALLLVDTDDAMRTILATTDLEMLRRHVLVQANDLGIEQQTMAKSLMQKKKDEDIQPSVYIDQYAPDQIIASVSTTQSGVLVLTNTYNPSWKAYVDGRNIPTFPAYHAFMGIILETPGTHTVVFRYEPPYATKRFFSLFN